MERNLPIRHFFNALHPFDAACIGIYVYQIFNISLLFTKVHGEAPNRADALNCAALQKF